MKEDIFWKELFLFVLHNVDNEVLQLYKQISPLLYDDSLLVSMMISLKNSIYIIEHLDLDSLYEDVENKEERYKLLDRN